MKKLLFFVLLFGTSLVTIAQEPKKPEYRPDWVFNTPHPGNSTYLYVVEYGEAANKREALNQAMARVFQSTANRIGQFVSTEAINRAVQEGTNYEVIGRNMKVPVNKVCEFATQDKYNYHWTVYVLCQVAKSGSITPEFESYDLCNAHTIFDKNIKYYNQRVEQKELTENLDDKQFLINKLCYSFGGIALGAGALMELGWLDDNVSAGKAGIYIMGAGLITMFIPPIVKVSFKAAKAVKKNKVSKTYYGYSLDMNEMDYLKEKQIDDVQLSIGFVSNGVGVKCTF